MMRNLLQSVGQLAATALLLTFASCEKAKDVDEPKPVDVPLSVTSTTVTPSTASLEVLTAEGATIFYDNYASTEQPQPQDQWTALETVEGKVTIELSGLTENTAYTTEIYSEDAAGNVSEVLKSQYSTTGTPIVTAETIAEAATPSSAQIKVTTTSVTKLYYAHYFKDQRPADGPSTWSELVIEENGEHTITIEGLTPSIYDNVHYTVEVYGEGGGATSEYVTADFMTLKEEMVYVTDIASSTFGVEFNLRFSHSITAGVAKAVAYKAYTASNFRESTFEGDVSWESTKHAFEDGQFNVADQYLLSPNTEYILAVAPVTTNEQGDKYSVLAGPITTYTFTTADYNFDSGSTASAAVAIDTESITFGEFAYTATRSEECIGYYQGVVESSLLSGTTIKDFVLTDQWLKSSSYKTFYAYDSNIRDYALVSELTNTVRNLEAGTEYTIFTVAISANGQMGEINSEVFTTDALNFDAAFSTNITIDPLYVTANINLDLGTATKAYYFYSSSHNYLEDETGQKALDKLLAETSASFPDVWDENGTYTIQRLDYNTPHRLYILPTGPNGEFGVMQTFDFSTVTSDYSSSATINYTVVSSSLDDWDAQSLNLSIELQNGAVGYYAKSLASYDLTYQGDAPVNTDYANSLFTSGSIISLTSYFYTETTLEQTIWETGDALVIIPVDAENKLGAPVVIKHQNAPTI